MPPVTDDLSASTLHQGLRTRYMGREFIHLARAESTQNVAAEAGRRGAAEGLVVSADEQSAGRGRLARTWVSPPGASLLVSVLLRPPPDALPAVVMVAALAAARAIEAVAPDLSPQIKWPNDVLLNGRKTCGILVETVYSDDAPRFAVLGIGLNVDWDTSAIPEIAETATSLSREARRPFARREVLQRLLEALEALYEEAKGGGDVHSQWRSRLATLGRRVRVRGGDIAAEGIAEDVDPSGALLLRTSDGRLITVHAGDVTLRE